MALKCKIEKCKHLIIKMESLDDDKTYGVLGFEFVFLYLFIFCIRNNKSIYR